MQQADEWYDCILPKSKARIVVLNTLKTVDLRASKTRKKSVAVGSAREEKTNKG